MVNIIEQIHTAMSKSEIWYVVKQYQKYRKSNGRTRKYLSYAYYYKDSERFRKCYIRKWDIEIIRSEIRKAKLKYDTSKSEAINYLSGLKYYELIKREVIDSATRNPELYTQRALISLLF
jgi:ribosomal protein L20